MTKISICVCVYVLVCVCACVYVLSTFRLHWANIMVNQLIYDKDVYVQKLQKFDKAQIVSKMIHVTS